MAEYLTFVEANVWTDPKDWVRQQLGDVVFKSRSENLSDAEINGAIQALGDPAADSVTEQARGALIPLLDALLARLRRLPVISSGEQKIDPREVIKALQARRVELVTEGYPTGAPIPSAASSTFGRFGLYGGSAGERTRR